MVAKDIPDNSVVAGNPAQFICHTDEYIEKYRREMSEGNTWHTHYAEKLEMIQVLEHARIGFDV